VISCERASVAAFEVQIDKRATVTQANGKWVEGTVQEFLTLSDADMELIETRLAASRLLKAISGRT
jgi:hypothetical protein